MDYENMTKEELIDYLNNLTEDFSGKYGLVWDKEKEPEKIVVDCDKYIPILLEQKNKNIINKSSENILIEGDNFHSLSVLNYTHKESIDVIYIDPPYNTGSKDFMYNDKYIDSEDGYRHSKWLNFMEKRLRIARNLLKEDGYIFISINFIEQAQLKLLCDKIFGENNMVGEITWESTTQPINSGSSRFGLQQKTEWILVYCKNFNDKRVFKLKELDNGLTYPHEGKLGKCRFEIIEKSDAGSYKRNTMKYEILGKTPREGKRWQIGKETAEELIRKDRLEIVDGIVKKAVYPEDELEKKKYSPFWSHFSAKDVGTAQVGKDELNSILNRAVGFDTVKPVKLIKEILSHFDNTITVLDFFAGSGTTGQAVLELNKEDNGTRRFILCTNNEGNICTDITYPRLNNVIKGYNNISPLGGNLRYYTTTFVNKVGTRDQLYYDLTEKCIPMLCVKADTYELVEKNKEYAIYSNEDRTEYSCVYFDIFGKSYDKFINTIKEIKEHKNLYIFSLSEYVNEDNFKGINNYSIEPIPYKILDLYKNVVKMSKES